LSQLWDELEPPADFEGRRDRLVCVNTLACVYLIREIYSSPIPDGAEELKLLRRKLRLIESAMSVAQLAMSLQFNFSPPPCCELGRLFRQWVAANSVDPVDTLDVSKMVGEDGLPSDAEQCYQLALREHLVAVMGLSAVMLLAIGRA